MVTPSLYNVNNTLLLACVFYCDVLGYYDEVKLKAAAQRLNKADFNMRLSKCVIFRFMLLAARKKCLPGNTPEK